MAGRSGSARCGVSGWGGTGAGRGGGVTGRGASAICGGAGGGGGGGGGGGAGASTSGLGGGGGGGGLGTVWGGGGSAARGASGAGGAGGGGTIMALGGGGGTEAGAGGADEGGTATGAPGSREPWKTMSNPCSTMSSAPWRGARGSISRKITMVKSRCASTEARTARPPRPGRCGPRQPIGRRPPPSGAPGRVNSGSIRRIGGQTGPEKRRHDSARGRVAE